MTLKRRVADMHDLAKYITSIPDFPKEGVLFRDITSLLNDGEGLRTTIDLMVEQAKRYEAEAIAGMESRGFLFGVPVAYALGLPFIPIRKAGKLPRETYAQDYVLEYGTATLEVHKDDLAPGTRVVIIDDLIATGGTAQASAQLIEKVGAEIAGFIFLLELEDLKGQALLKDYPVTSFIKY